MDDWTFVHATHDSEKPDQESRSRAKRPYDPDRNILEKSRQLHVVNWLDMLSTWLWTTKVIHPTSIAKPQIMVGPWRRHLQLPRAAELGKRRGAERPMLTQKEMPCSRLWKRGLRASNLGCSMAQPSIRNRLGERRHLSFTRIGQLVTRTSVRSRTSITGRGRCTPIRAVKKRRSGRERGEDEPRRTALIGGSGITARVSALEFPYERLSILGQEIEIV